MPCENRPPRPRLEHIYGNRPIETLLIGQAFGREKKRALLENQEAFTAQAEAMTDRLQKQAAVSLQQVRVPLERGWTRVLPISRSRLKTSPSPSDRGEHQNTLSH